MYIVLVTQKKGMEMNRIKGFVVGLGVGTVIVAGLACGAEDAQEPTEVGQASDAPQLRDQPALGSPQPPLSTGSPLPSLSFDDVDYIHSGSAELPSEEGAVFVIDGTEINSDDLEVVGNTSDGNAPGIQDGLVVYRLADDVTNDVYTFYPGEDHVNPEDGQVFKGQDVWTRWTTR